MVILMALSHKKQHNIVSPNLRDTYFTKEESTRLVTLSVRIARELVNISSSDRTTKEELQEFKLLSGKYCVTCTVCMCVFIFLFACTEVGCQCDLHKSIRRNDPEVGSHIDDLIEAPTS